MAKSALRGKDALAATVMSPEWEFETSTRRMDTEQRRVAAKIKAACLDTASWLKAAALLRFLEPLVALNTLMGTDDGEVLSFFAIGMFGIQQVWDSQPYVGERTKGFGGVSHAYALRVNKMLYAKYQKHQHPLDGTCALLNPYNNVRLSLSE